MLLCPIKKLALSSDVIISSDVMPCDDACDSKKRADVGRVLSS